ncbi:MAG: Crp/Fnr family transcriptional regulator [Betaproteobacteria bacterium]
MPARLSSRSTPDASAAIQQIANASVRGLALRGDVRRYRKDTILIEEGDRGETLYIILAGRLRAYSAAANGREITYGIYGPGEYLGEMSLDGGVRSANVETVEAATCAVIARETLRAYIQEHPDFAFDLLAKVIWRARAATLSAKSLALHDVYGRLKLLLESLPRERHGELDVVAERLTHQDLANRLGCSREMISRVMKDLENGGYVEQHEGHVALRRTLPARW